MAEAPVFFNGQKIAQIGKAVFSGSATPIQQGLPRTIGVALFPSSGPSRQISVNCFLSIANKSKSQLERLQVNLHDHLANCLSGVGTLIVNDNVYPEAAPVSNNFDIMPEDDYLTFTVTFNLKHDMGYITSSGIHSSQARSGSFVFEFADQSLVTQVTEFPILHNYEVGASVSYTLNQKPRALGRYGKDTLYEGGSQILSLQCWAVNDTVKNLESYLANYLIGPLGKRGDLNISGKTYERAVMTSVSNQPHISGTVQYNIKFLTTLC